MCRCLVKITPTKMAVFIKRICYTPRFYPRPPKNLHRYICHICDISQLWIIRSMNSRLAKVRKSFRKFYVVKKLTRIWLGIFVQEGNPMDWNFLHLAGPVAVGQAAGERASLPWKYIVSSQLCRDHGTCEVVHPSTSPWPSSSAGWVVAAALMLPDVASGWAPRESTWRLCC